MYPILETFFLLSLNLKALLKEGVLDRIKCVSYMFTLLICNILPFREVQ